MNIVTTDLYQKKHHQTFATEPTTWVEVNTNALAHNLALYKKTAPTSLLAIVIKSNAYGHGIELVGNFCDTCPDVSIICVVSLEKAVYLRSLGIKKRILVLSIVMGNLELFFEHALETIVYDFDLALKLSSISITLNTPLKIHIKIDTGLSRLGFLADEAVPYIMAIKNLPGLIIEGIFTHFSEAESEDQTFTNLQQQRFNNLIENLAELGITIPLVHSSNSASLAANKHCHTSLTRLGVGTYGLWPSPANKAMVTNLNPEFKLIPALAWKTKVLQIKQLPVGSFVGYDRTYQTTKPTIIAILPVGYWDGIDRKRSHNGGMMIKGCYAPIIGRIAMNMMTVDVTEIPHVATGDIVTIIGSEKGITADDIAAECNTINYEVVTRINPLLPRISK